MILSLAVNFPKRCSDPRINSFTISVTLRVSVRWLFMCNTIALLIAAGSLYYAGSSEVCWRSLSLVALVAGISKTSETTCSTHLWHQYSRWAGDKSLKNCTMVFKVISVFRIQMNLGTLLVTSSTVSVTSVAWSLHTSIDRHHRSW